MQEFTFEVKDKEGCENQVENHLSWLKTNVVSGKWNVVEAFPDESIVVVSHGNPPWYADLANYVVCGILSDRVNSKNKEVLVQCEEVFLG